MDNHYESMDWIKKFNPKRELHEELAFSENPYKGSDILAEIASHSKIAIQLRVSGKQADYSAVKYLGKLLENFCQPDSKGEYFSNSIHEAVCLWDVMKRYYKKTPLFIETINKMGGLAKSLNEVAERLINIEETRTENLEELASFCSGVSYFAQIASDSGRVKYVA